MSSPYKSLSKCPLLQQLKSVLLTFQGRTDTESQLSRKKMSAPDQFGAIFAKRQRAGGYEWLGMMTATVKFGWMENWWIGATPMSTF
jgi:hypothetical protein